MEERRQILRHRTLKGGHIFVNRASAIDCRVRNMSPIGAMLEVASPIGIPDDFKLTIDGEAEPHECHVVWRIANRLGVEFAGA